MEKNLTDKNEKWLEWAVELQSLAQAGLHYGKGWFDLERYERIRDIAAEMISYKTEIPDDKILLVQENNGTWSMPGGWVDVNVSVGENVVKEVKEEAGLDVTPDLVIAVQDREKHNLPVYAHKVCKVFVLCSVTGGSFEENIETVESRYFSLDELPRLATEKNNEEQIRMCFEAYHSEKWKTLLE